MNSHAAASELLPVRAGVYSRVEDAQRAVTSLRDAGFTTEQITVVCSDDTKERHFKEFEHQQPAGKNTPAAAATGGTLGAALGGIATGALGVAIGGPAFIVLGGAGLITGAIVGGFLGAMARRGVDKEAADYYDQAVMHGKLLVAVETDDPQRQERAARIFAAHAPDQSGTLPSDE